MGGRDNEFKAAAKYFAGGKWNTSLGRTYANQVLAKVDIYQQQIDISLKAMGEASWTLYLQDISVTRALSKAGK